MKQLSYYSISDADIVYVRWWDGTIQNSKRCFKVVHSRAL